MGEEGRRQSLTRHVRGRGAFGEIVVFAVPATANLEVVEAARADAFAGKLVIDATNAIDDSGAQPELALANEGSAGEQLQRALPNAHVVKCFNTTAASLMFRPDTPFGPPDMFIAGDGHRENEDNDNDP